VRVESVLGSLSGGKPVGVTRVVLTSPVVVNTVGVVVV